MKIAIITQPLMSNYGGLLQNWALQQVLLREFYGSDVITFDQVESLAPWHLRVASKLKYIFKAKSRPIVTDFENFRNSHINCTNKARCFSDFKKLDKKYKPDIYIVGSDQVWRPKMIFNFKANFLGFTKCKNKIAYAASFGVSNWEFTPEQTNQVKHLLHQFKAVSVREDDGVSLCQNYLSIDALHVLDPTLLLTAEDYNKLLTANADVKKYVFTYILDTNENKRAIIRTLIDHESELNASFDINGYKPYIPLSVEQWIEGIKKARMVVCDSFHGVAFSIIYNKEFFVLENTGRGNSRILSLLNQFGLQDRLIHSVEQVKNMQSINWDIVNKKRDDLRALSLQFLHSNIDNI